MPQAITGLAGQQPLEPGLGPQPLQLLAGDQVGEHVGAGDRLPPPPGAGHRPELPERLAGGQGLDRLGGAVVGGLPQLHGPLDDQVQEAARPVLAEDAGAPGEELDLHRRRGAPQQRPGQLVEGWMPGQEAGDLLHGHSIPARRVAAKPDAGRPNGPRAPGRPALGAGRPGTDAGGGT